MLGGIFPRIMINMIVYLYCIPPLQQVSITQQLISCFPFAGRNTFILLSAFTLKGFVKGVVKCLKQPSIYTIEWCAEGLCNIWWCFFTVRRRENSGFQWWSTCEDRHGLLSNQSWKFSRSVTLRKILYSCLRLRVVLLRNMIAEEIISVVPFFQTNVLDLEVFNRSMHSIFVDNFVVHLAFHLVMHFHQVPFWPQLICHILQMFLW